MKSMYKYWGLHIPTDINFLEVVLDSFWVVWRGLLMSLEPKYLSWQFPRYWWFNKWYHSSYQLICLISQPLLIASIHDWYWLKGIFKGFWVPLRQWESSKNWWRYSWMKFVIQSNFSISFSWSFSVSNIMSSFLQLLLFPLRLFWLLSLLFSFYSFPN